jgi:hypothetical protein
MSDELVKQESITGLLAKTQSKYANVPAARKMAVSSMLPYLSLVGRSSNIAADHPEKVGHFAIMRGNKAEILDSTVVIVVYAWRPVARSFGEKITAYNPESAVFQDIEARASVKDSQCAYGPEFLISLPDYGDAIVAYHMSSQTARNEAPNVLAVLEGSDTGYGVCKQRSELISSEKYKWYGAVTEPHELDVTLPDLSLLEASLEKFNNPADDIEMAKDGDGDSGSSRD